MTPIVTYFIVLGFIRGGNIANRPAPINTGRMSNIICEKPRLPIILSSTVVT
jgi:hypothetical protein